MRFLLYNIRYGVGGRPDLLMPLPGLGYLRDTSSNLARIRDFIKELQPDVVGLIEVDAGSIRSRRKNQAQIIAEALGHWHCFESKYGADSLPSRVPILRKQGNAFLTNRTVLNPRFHYFDTGVKRLIIELELDDLCIFLVHLALTFRHRHYQLRHLHHLVKQVSKPVIVAGDFNTLWGDYELDLFMEATGLRSANAEARPSYPSWAPRRQLDFILYGPGLEVTRFDIPQVRFSDHLPLVCDFRITAAETAMTSVH